MGKFPFKRPRIISKKFPEVTSSIDGVTKSLQDLVFSYHEQVELALQKKHLMMAISSLVLLIVLGSFISPKGKADSSIFYPETCLGGWVNPALVQGELQTTSNGDESQFTKENSAILPKNTNAELYCGNFKVKGALDTATQPKKIIVSLALTNKEETLAPEEMLPLVTASTTASSTIDAVDIPLVATSTQATSTETATSSQGAEQTQTVSTESQGTSTDTTLIDSVNAVINTLLESTSQTSENQGSTEPSPSAGDAATPLPEATSPQSRGSRSVFDALLSYFVTSAFAEESTSTETVTTEATSTDLFSVSTSTATSSVLDTATTTEYSTTTEEVATSTDTQSQNNFLEVFYTFDGVTWTSLGTLNDISMKYRTFEIPVTASTSWSDMDKLQIKLISTKSVQETPTVYLDGIKVEVLYETALTHEHPDFARDTILKDEIVDGVRILTIINFDTKEQEVWYMSVNTSSLEVPVVTGATSTQATGTEAVNGQIVSTSSSVQTTVTEASTTSSSTGETVVVNLLRRNWKKYEGDKDSEKEKAELVAEIKEMEKKEEEKKEEEKLIIPNFASDTIKLMKGLFSSLVLVQVERTYGGTSTNTPVSLRNELWIYNAETGEQEKVGTGTSTAPITIARDYPVGIKGGFVFWLSDTRQEIYAYNLESKQIIKKELPVFDPSQGERAEIHFEETSWKVIVGSEGMSFWRSDVGEVFSDEDGKIVEALRSKMSLDTVLDHDTISNLSLPVRDNDQ